MKNASFKLLSILALGSLILLGACGEDEEDPLPLPVAGFEIPEENPVAGEEVTFTSTSENATGFTWSFGDGTTSTEENPTHTYESEGDFTITLTVTGEGGDSTVDRTLTVVYPTAIYADGLDLALYAVDFDNSSNTSIGTYPDNDRHYPVAVSNDRSEIYYIDNFEGILYKANADGSNESIITDQAGFFYPSDIAVDADGNLYISDRGDSGTGEGATIYKVTPDGTSSVLYSDADGLEVPAALAIDQSTGDLYINDVGAEDSGFAADGIWKGTTSGGTIEKVITGGGYSIAVGGGNLYYNDAFVDENLKVASLSSLDTQAKYADLDESNCYGIEFFSGKVYWTDLGANVDGGEGSFKRANASSGASPMVILSNLADPRGLVVFK